MIEIEYFSDDKYSTALMFAYINLYNLINKLKLNLD